MSRIVSEQEFQIQLFRRLLSLDHDVSKQIGSVTGPGRSGAIAAVYASHMMRVPFIPYGATVPPLGRLLIVDTARESGATLRKAERRYAHAQPVIVFAFDEPPRVTFWYEARKPQHYRHEARAHAA